MAETPPELGAFLKRAAELLLPIAPEGMQARACGLRRQGRRRVHQRRIGGRQHPGVRNVADAMEAELGAGDSPLKHFDPEKRSSNGRAPDMGAE